MYDEHRRRLFWVKVRKSLEPDGCWEWTASGGRHGYGLFFDGAKLRPAHRVAYAMAHGEMPTPGVMVLHRCDNPPCVRASHLRLGSHSENMDDRQVRGRTARGDRHVSRVKPETLMRGDAHYARTEPERLPRGESHGMTPLTEPQVREMRERFAGGWGATVLAKEYGVDRTTIYNIVKRRTWAHVI